jgi:hypothetical protein
MRGGRPAERRFTVGGSGKSVARCHRTVLAYWKFESISLQRRVLQTFSSWLPQMSLIDQLWLAIETLPEPEPQSDAKRPSKQDEVIAMRDLNGNRNSRPYCASIAEVERQIAALVAAATRRGNGR